MIQFIENALASLHSSWYVMFVFTVIPILVSIPRHLSLVYIVLYAFSGAFFVLYGIPEVPQRGTQGNNNNSSLLQSKMDEKMSLFHAIKLQSA